MTREELIKKVALKMDEISSSDDVIVNVNAGDNNPLYTQINNLLNESINEVLAKAPVYRINDRQIKQTSECATEELFNDTRIAAMITLPNDFLRLVSIDDASFQRPIIDLATEGDDMARKQRNKFLVAKNAKPVGVISTNPVSGGRVIKCYSYDKNTTPNPLMTYIVRYGVNPDENLDVTSHVHINDYLADVVSWVCAGKVFSSRGDSANMQICDNNAMALMV